MTTSKHFRTLRVIVALACASVLAAVAPAWAGPYLRTSIEISKAATSQKDCGGQIRKVLLTLQKERHLTVSRDNDSLATTNDSTVGVECIFVGPNEQKRNQWIFYIAIASTNGQESANLMRLLRKKFSEIERID
jgi:hypothetical protein